MLNWNGFTKFLNGSLSCMNIQSVFKIIWSTIPGFNAVINECFFCNICYCFRLDISCYLTSCGSLFCVEFGDLDFEWDGQEPSVKRVYILNKYVWHCSIVDKAFACGTKGSRFTIQRRQQFINLLL